MFSIADVHNSTVMGDGRVVEIRYMCRIWSFCDQICSQESRLQIDDNNSRRQHIGTYAKRAQKGSKNSKTTSLNILFHVYKYALHDYIYKIQYA